MSIKQGSKIIAGSGGSADGETIKNQNTTSSIEKLKMWEGTEEEYQALPVKASDTLYNTTGTGMSFHELLDKMYPVGAIYISTTTICPMSALIGEWQLVGADRVLQGAGTRGEVGTTIEAGLPNITGDIWLRANNNTIKQNGCIYLTANQSRSPAFGTYGGDTGSGSSPGINASLSNPIYGNSDTVQPDAYLVNIWRRVL